MTLLLYGGLITGILWVGRGEQRLKPQLVRFDAEKGESITDWKPGLHKTESPGSIVVPKLRNR